MFKPHPRGLAVALALAYPYWSMAADAANSPTSDAAPATTAATTTQLDTVTVITSRQKLDAARNGLSPDTGSSVYRFDKQDIANLPLGEGTPINQVILQSPGVVQDSYGQLHVRGDHANLQYRINGMVIPEAISGFGQSLETRFADHISILTGALPAQYGYRTAGVVDIRTKGENFDNGGSISYTAGSNGHSQTSGEIGGTQGAFSYYLTGSVLKDGLGIENPTPERSAVHDETHQGKSFGYLSYLLNADSRVNLLFGTSTNRFEIPDVPGATPDPTATTAPPGFGAGADPATFDARQKERNRFGVLAFQSTAGDNVDYQVALFQRFTDVHYQPDQVGDLLFKGVAADVTRHNQASGVQSDLSWRVNSDHTVRSGLFVQQERYDVTNDSLVFGLDGSGAFIGTSPELIQDNSSLTGHLWGAYLQDEWQLSKQLTLNYGARYDSVNTVVSEQQLSPRLGVVYDVSKDTRLHAGYSRYFTPPPTEKIDTTSVAKFLNTTFLNTTNALPSDANTAVKSERSNYFDLGAAHQLTPQITLGVDGYYRDVKHLQDEGQFGAAPIYSAFNYAQGRIYGIEFSGTYRNKGLSAYGNLSFSRAKGKDIETGQFNFGQDELDYIATHWVHLDHDQRLTGSAGLSYRWPDTLTVSADALYGGGLRNGFANTGHLPSYTSVNMAVARTFDMGQGLGKLDGRLALLNVLDTSYQLRDGTGIGVGAPQYGQRRAVYINVTKNF